MTAPIASPSRFRPLLVPLACYGTALLVGLLALAVSRAWTAGFSGADEPAHFLNAWFVSLYERHAPGHNPLAFATEFYLHYPKLSIGHWPPAYYCLVAPLFLLLAATPQTALALNLAVGALPALGAGLFVARLERSAPAAVAAALLAAAIPVALEGNVYFMLDQPLAACALAATAAWLAYAACGRARRAFAFALLAALAILIKGNGWLMVFVPAWHIALTRQWRLLARPATWGAAALAAALVVPWYALTAGISADGFNYQAGPAYAARALAFNLRLLADNITLLGLALAGFALWHAYRRRAEDPGRWSIVAGCAALILSALTLQSLVPADLSERYMAPALPPLAALAVVGAAALLRGRFAPAHTAVASAVVAAVLLLPGARHLALREPKADLRLEDAAALAGSAGGAWLIEGGSGAEGAFIAAASVRDPGLNRYTVRGSKLLADSDFMGTSFRLKYANDASVLAALRRLGLAGIVLVRREGMADEPDSIQLAHALAVPGSPYRLAATLTHRNRPGTTLVYRAAAPVVANAAAIRALGTPAKAARAMRLAGAAP